MAASPRFVISNGGLQALLLGLQHQIILPYLGVLLAQRRVDLVDQLRLLGLCAG